MLDRMFGLSERGTRVSTEVLGGATTFVTMAYIIVVNPAILAFAGIPVGPSTVATILTAVFGSLLMGLYANRPIAVAPYMGENAFIAFGLAALGITWQQRLGTVFVSGVVFLVITLAGIRGWLARSISTSLKHSFAAGIGLFLAFVGLYKTGIVTSAAAGQPARALLLPGGLLRAPDVPVKIGNLHDPQVLLAVAGFLLIAVLLHRRVRGAILVGIAVTAVAGSALGVGRAPTGVVAWPFGGTPGWGAVALQLDVGSVLRLSFLPILLTLFLMSFLDTLGTLVGVGAAGGMLDAKGDFPQVERPMLVDALTCIFSGLAGTSTSGAYIESATGIREGARTGLAAVTTAALFAVTLFFIPLVEPLQHLSYAYGPALVAVGAMMAGSLARVDFEDLTELIPAFATVVMMVFTYNIANGLTAGLVLHPVMKLAAGRWREVGAGSAVLAGLCLVYYGFGLPH
ncbi:MAG TPA: NCS2 family permease [Candidatus Saccharimonadales bacterium]|nr:NCS2 family permease [Candidatus Saccharimonadales bacterium]